MRARPRLRGRISAPHRVDAAGGSNNPRRRLPPERGWLRRELRHPIDGLTVSPQSPSLNLLVPLTRAITEPVVMWKVRSLVNVGTAAGERRVLAQRRPWERRLPARRGGTGAPRADASR